MNIKKVRAEALKIIKGAFTPAVFFRDIPSKWYLYAIIPAVAFFLFFMQVGFDRLAIFTASGWWIVLLCIIGVVFGAAFAFAESGVICLFCRLSHKKYGFSELLCMVSMTFVFPLLVNLVGLIFKFILQMNTSLSFGLCGILLSFVFLYEIFLSLEIGGIKNRKLTSVFGVSLIMMLGLSFLSLLMMI